MTIRANPLTQYPIDTIRAWADAHVISADQLADQEDLRRLTRFYATFGEGHGYAGAHVEILAEDRHAATAFMIKNHGDQWSQEVLPFHTFICRPGAQLSRRLATLRQQPGCAPDGSLVFSIVKEDQHA